MVAGSDRHSAEPADVGVTPVPNRGPAGEGPNGARGLKAKTVRGVAWNGAARGSTRLFQFVVMIVLARLLEPKDFGIIGVVAIVSGFVAMLAEFGISTAIIQREDLTSEQLCAAFWATAVAGLGLWVATTAAAPALATLFGYPQLRVIVVVATFGLVIGALGIIQRALLSRTMDFRALALADIGGSLAYGLVSICLAVSGAGVWSLVAGGLAQVATSTTLMWLLSPWRPTLRVDWRGLGGLLSFGSKVFGSSVIYYFRSNIDFLVVARLLGAVPLGHYTMAFRLADFPRTSLSPTVTAVALPALSSVQSANERVLRGYTKMVRVLSLAFFPLLIGLSVVGREFVLVVYGRQWLPAVAPLRALLWMGLLLVVCEPVGTVLYVKGRPGLHLGSSALYAVVLLVSVVAAAREGIGAVGMAVLVATSVYFVTAHGLAWRVIGVRPKDWIGAVLPASIGCAVMAAVVLAFQFAQTGMLHLGDAAWLVSAVALGAASYIGALCLLGAPEVKEAMAAVSGVLRRRGSGSDDNAVTAPSLSCISEGANT